MNATRARSLLKISVRGVVQGVGFRPFVYKLATTQGLTGWVCNTSKEVLIEVEGETGTLERFLERLKTQAPPRSQIEKITFEHTDPVGHRAFQIRKSLSREGQYQLISPDIGTCPQCLQELFDPQDRRHLYPFINCTNCGPRLTIIKDIPYDRPKTTMRPFVMCPACQKEYDNPLDRRFHAQPNCCGVCGPQLELADHKGRPMDTKDPIEGTAALLKKGFIVALKGLGGFLLACDATDGKAVELLRHRKKRSSKPFALMMSSVEAIKKYCHVSREEETLLNSPMSPIVLLKSRQGTPAFPEVSPCLDTLGVMLPYTPLHHLLMRSTGRPLVMTSGNLSEEPIVGDNHEAVRKLGHITDYFLRHDRDIYALCDDSVTMVEEGEPQIIRRARGYAPQPLVLPFKSKQILACGAELKNTFCMTKDHYAFMSQHIGDMDNVETLDHFQKMLDLYMRLFRLAPRIVAHDKHPNYYSTRFALDLKRKDPSFHLVPVQHHHAHIVSGMVEKGLQRPVLGVAFDGTGYGDDGAIWGGEFLLAEYHGFRRLGHLEYVPLPGGDAAIRKPYRMAASYLLTLLGEEAFEKWMIRMGQAEKHGMQILKAQVTRGLNSPMTSSAGRLFDAVSALAGIRGEIDYEGQAAIELEMAGKDAKGSSDAYPFDIEDGKDMKVIRLKRLFSALLKDLEHEVPKAVVSARFHHTVARLIADMCKGLSDDLEIDQVVFSGGVFQNRLLQRLACARTREAGLKVFTHSEVPCNDGCISLGQAVIAHAVTEE